MTSNPDPELIYHHLLKQHGPQNWWPADSPFEVMIGAILTQNTAWTNVEKAIRNLKQADALSLQALINVSQSELAEWIRPSGYYNIKAKRLQEYCRWLHQCGGVEALNRLETEVLREELLNVHGIGPETADDILLYAFDRPVFVIDAYTRRIFMRLGMIAGDEKYDHLRLWLEGVLKGDAALYNQYHALIVSHGKNICKKSPNCHECSIGKVCNFRNDN